MTKKDRAGKIYLDYLRNDFVSSAVAPLSPRARAGAPVSMPLSWSQVRAGLDPMRFTLRTVPALIAKSSAWKEYCDSERPQTCDRAVAHSANSCEVLYPPGFPR